MGSKTCRPCYDASIGDPCPYVDRSGRRCDIPAKHESGYCGKHRRIVERVPKPRLGKPTAITPLMLLYALDDRRESGNLTHAARRLWAIDVDEVRTAFKSHRTLASSLAKRLRKLGWRTEGQIEAGYWVLVAEHGSVEWSEESA
jgi:hypothetical protein